MKRYTVLRDKGLPVDNPIHAFGETFEADDERGAEWVKQGYAEPASRSAVSKSKKSKSRKPRAKAAENADSSEAAAPARITKKMAKELKALGHSKDDIEKMTPDEAQTALTKDT